MERAAERPLVSPDDDALIRQFRAGDMEAFNVLYRRHLPGVYNRVRFVVPTEDVEDVTQEVFIAAVKSLGKFRGDSQFSTWLRSLTNHKVVEYYRRRGRRREDSMTGIAEETKGSGPDESRLAEDRIFVQRALQDLPQAYREVIVLRFAEDLPFQQIALLTGRNVEAVKSLFRRAIEALRTRLEQE